MLFAVVLLFLFMTSCEKEELIEAATQEENIVLSTDKNQEKPQDAAQRWKADAVKFYELIGEDPATLEDNFQAKSVHNAYNGGRLSHYFPNATPNSYDPLNFGTRTGTTQFIDLNLTNSQIHTVPDGYTNNRVGKVNFYLSGVNQTVTLNFSINVNNQSAVITPSTTAALHSRAVPNSSFAFGGAMKVTIHSNTNGWLWVQVKKSGTVVFSSLYRYNYNSGLDVRNGGNINLHGFGQSLVGPLPPWSPAGFTTYYSGYCGWF